VSALPDVYIELRDETVVLVANKEARKVLNRGFEKPQPQWVEVCCDDLGISARYRALELCGDCSAVLAAMVCAVHNAGGRAAVFNSRGRKFGSFSTYDLARDALNKSPALRKR
jgi:hypothetical protein